MKLFGYKPSTKQLLVILVPTVSIGVAFAAYTLYKKLRSAVDIEIVGQEDLDLPTVLENEYGDFRAICREADAGASEYLNCLPEEFFQFKNNLTKLVLTSLGRQVKYRRALVIGSSTAGFAFELSKHFAEVKGIESSFTKVVTSYQFQNAKNISYYFPFEGNYFTRRVTLNHKDIFQRFHNHLKNVQPLGNVQIVNADPSGRFSVQIGAFQLIILFSLNAITNPEALLSGLHRFVEQDGLLFIICDYNWERFTNRHLGFQIPDVTTTFDFLKFFLQKNFKLESAIHMPSATPVSLRSCTLHNYHVTTWRRLPTIQTTDDSDEADFD